MFNVGGRRTTQGDATPVEGIMNERVGTSKNEMDGGLKEVATVLIQAMGTENGATLVGTFRVVMIPTRL